MNTVYSIGYSLLGAENHIDSLLRQPKTLLVDTRLSPNSWQRQWKRENLQARYGKRYRWAGRYLGNTNYKGGPIDIADIDTGLAGLCLYLDEGFDLILLCQCKEEEECHRAVILQELIRKRPDTHIVRPDREGMAQTVVWALSIQQPYASWIMNPELLESVEVPPKNLENRDWELKLARYSPLVIHASQSFDQEAIDVWMTFYPRLREVFSTRSADYPRGLLGTVRFIDTWKQNQDFNPWFCGTYAFVLEYLYRFPAPIPYKGALKPFEVPREIVNL